MALVTLSPAGSAQGTPVSSCLLMLPRVGAWTADLELPEPMSIAGKVALTVGPDVLVGTVLRAAVEHGRMLCRVAAGGGGLGDPSGPKHFTSPTVAVVLRSIFEDVGEELSPSADQGVVLHQLQHWTKVAKPAGREVKCVLRKPGADVVWRHLADGKIWVGRETWPASDVKGWGEIALDGANESSELALEQAQVIWPGTALDDRRVDSVELRLSAGRVRATVFWASRETAASGGFGAIRPSWPRYELDRVKGSLRGLVLTPPEVDHLACYRAKLLRQHPNLRRVDVQPADPRLPPMSNIPLKVGVPGLEPVLAPGHQVLVGWEGGDQEFPYVWGWDAGEQGTVPIKETFHAQQIELGGHVRPLLDGFVHGQGKDSYTGMPYWMLDSTSSVVGGKK